MSHGHHHHHHHQPHDAGEHQHSHDYAEMEDILRRDFELKKDKIIEFMKKAGIKEGQHVLELGCGFAPLLELYCDSVGPTGSVTLTDPQSRLAERLAPRMAGRPNVRFVTGRAEDLSLSEMACPVSSSGGRYDMAVMVNVYHHLSDPEAVLAGLRDRLRPGGIGRLVVIDFVHDTFRLFASASASPAAAAAQARLSELIRPEATPVTGICSTRLEANGFDVKLNECFVLHDRFKSVLGDFYQEVFLSDSLNRKDVAEADRADLLATGLPALRDDPDAVLFSNIHVMLAAELK